MPARPPEGRAPEPSGAASARTELVHAIGDTAALSSSVVVLLASFGVASPLQAAFALTFVLFTPGWTLVRVRRLPVGSIELLVIVAFSISVIALAGHVTVTVLDWHWAATTGLGSTVVLGSLGWTRWQERGLPGAVGRSRAAAPLLTLDAFRPRAVWLPLATGLAGAGLTFFGLLRADEADIGRLGLYDTFTAPVWLGLGVLVVSTVIAIGEDRARLVVAGGLLGLLLVLLHGAPGIIEEQPRFFVAWIHVGFIEQISVDGALLPLQDARFSWPGFFAGGALLDQMAGTDGTRWMIRYAPVVANAFYVLAVWAMGSALGLRRSVRLLAGVVFVLANWAGQDYFSPQATGMMLALAMLVVIVADFPGDGLGDTSRLRRLLAPRDPSVARPVPRPERFGLPVLFVLAAALVISHQLTPVLLAMSLAVIGVLRLTSVRWLGVSIALMTLAWLSFGSEAFWFGQLEKITGSLGEVNSIVDANVNKSGGAIAPRELLLRARLVLSFGVWFAAGIGALVAWRRAWDRRTVLLIVLVGAPFPVLALQPYGGEVLIRVFFFTLLPASLLISMTVLRGGAPASAWKTATLAAVLVALIPVFVLARFGNEEFEVTRASDLAGAEVLMAEAPTGTRVYVANRQVLNEWRRVGDLRYVAVDSSAPEDFEASILEEPDLPAFVYLSESQEVYREQTESRPEGWVEELVADLVATGDYEVHYRQGPVAVLEWRS